MAVPRKQQVSLADTPYYHCISRCVRRAFLCGEDKVSGKSYEHRREWVKEKLLALGKVICINVGAYAVIINQQNIGMFYNSASWPFRAKGRMPEVYSYCIMRG